MSETCKEWKLRIEHALYTEAPRFQFQMIYTGMIPNLMSWVMEAEKDEDADRRREELIAAFPGISGSRRVSPEYGGWCVWYSHPVDWRLLRLLHDNPSMRGGVRVDIHEREACELLDQWKESRDA